MLNNDYCYAEFVTGGTYHSNKIYKINEFKLNGIITDCYRSLFLHNEDFKYYVDKTGSVKGYSGKHIADSIVFDFDNEKNLQEAKDEAVKFCLHLYHTYEVPYEFLRISFSGNKGFHICIPIQAVCAPEPKDNFYEIIKNIVKDIADGFKFLDYSIYDETKLLRILNTKHSKTGLFKIPLMFDELDCFPIEEIKKLAKNSREIDSLSVNELTTVKGLNELYHKWNNHNFDNQQQNFNSQPKRNEILDLITNGAAEGNRHLALIRLTAIFEDRDFDYDYTLAMLRLWNDKNKPPLTDNRLEAESKRAFDDDPLGGAKVPEITANKDGTFTVNEELKNLLNTGLFQFYGPKF